MVVSSPSEPHATISISDDGILTVMFQRPAKLNAISHEMTALLWEAVTMLEDRDDLRVMVIAAQGKYFTAGQDLSSAGGNRPGNPETEHLHPGWNFRRNYRSHHLLYDEFEAVEKPIVMAIQGICLGAGVEMAGSVDFRFCTPNAEFALPEVNLGAIAGSGGTSRITRLLGPHWAKWIAMAGMRVPAEKAYHMGLIHEIYPEDGFLDHVYAFCRHLISLPAEALGLAKLAVDMYTDINDRGVARHIDRLAVYSTIGEWNARTAKFKK